MNSEKLNESEEAKQYHSHILTLLSQCYANTGNTKEVLELLDKSLAVNKSVLGETHYTNCSICMAMINIYLKKKMYKEAIERLLIVFDITESKYGLKALETVLVMEDIADAYYKNKECEEAIEYQKRVVEVYKEIENVDAKVIKQANTKLSEMYE
jgi:tetratricopeptide (TPR) repeat protein